MWLGIDIGTSGVKAVLIDDDGALMGQASAGLSVERPRPLWSEQDPNDWWRATQQAVLSLPADKRAAVRGVGLSGQMHGAVLLGKDDSILRPAILWNDGRSSEQCRALAATVDVEAITGNIAMPGFTAPKALWVREHEPEIFAATTTILLPKDFVRLRMTGDKASDLSDSAGTLWLDTGARRWSCAMLEACGLDERHMPQLHEGSDLSGMLTNAAAAALGLPVVPVAAGGGDNAAGAIGVGVTEPGQGFLSLGTSGVIFTVSDGYAPNSARAVHSFCHALPGRWHQMAVVLSAASALDWVVRVAGFVDVTTALTAAEALGHDADVPIFLPYLSGERTPHNDPAATGTLTGLTHDHGPAHLVRAALEGVAFALADGADAVRAAGTTIDALTVIGGGERSGYWGKILATALGCRLDYVEDGSVGPARGAALLARIAVTGEAADIVCKSAPPTGSIAPDPGLGVGLSTRRARFVELYPAIKSRSESACA